MHFETCFKKLGFQAPKTLLQMNNQKDINIFSMVLCKCPKFSTVKLKC